MNPLVIIQAIRESDVYVEKIYLNGGCFAFYKILKTIFPTAVAYIDEAEVHIVTNIEGRLYDIKGLVEGDYYPLPEEKFEMCEKWSFSRNYFLYKECPHCEEPMGVDRGY